ncbi:MAG: DUF1736 domain-containing protein [Bradymonadales bacterium]|nr:DUF1736 domain-containing protein [Bradymonadales bacterium]
MIKLAGRQVGWPTLFFIGSAVLCTLVYLPALGGEFLFDDVALLVEKTCWRGLSKIPAMFGLGEPNGCTYRPMRFLTYTVDYTIGGLNPAVFHISNLVYHLLTAWAAFALFRRWAPAGAAAVMVALWALHPVQTDAVAYISGRRDIVSTLFFLLAYLQLAPPQGVRLGMRRLGLGAVLYYLAVQSKEMAVTLPAVLLWAGLVGYGLRLRQIRAHLAARWPVYLVLFGGAALYVFFLGLVAPRSFMAGHWWGGSPARNFATVFSLYPRYLWLVLWPARLVGDYFPHTIPLARSFADPMVLTGIGLYAAMLAFIVLALRRGWRATAFGLGWFLLTMLPVSHIIPHHEMFAEHYLYLPLVGLCGACLTPVQRLIELAGQRRRLAMALVMLLGILLAAAGTRTALRAADFRTARSFYEAGYHQAPGNTRLTYNLGLTYLEDGECERAVPLMIQAAERLHRRSGMSRGNLVAFLNCSERLGYTEVVDTLVTALLERYPADPLGLAWRGRRHIEAGRYMEAALDLGRSVVLDQGSDSDAVAMLALAFNRADHPLDALETLRRYPGDHVGYCEQEVEALVRLGTDHYDQALIRVQSCLLHYPQSLPLLEYRAGLYFSAGYPDLALADIALMEQLGASPQALERVRRWQTLRGE